MNRFEGRDTQLAAGPVAWVGDLSASISQGIINAGTWHTMLALGAVLAAVVTATFITRRRR